MLPQQASRATRTRGLQSDDAGCTSLLWDMSDVGLARAEPDSKSLETMRKFSEQYARR